MKKIFSILAVVSFMIMLGFAGRDDVSIQTSGKGEGSNLYIAAVSCAGFAGCTYFAKRKRVSTDV